MSLPRIPSLNWLRVFDAAARHQSFASAGRELNMSAAAVSQQISALESYLGKPLFVRGANRVSLTAEATEFLPTVQVSLHAIETKAAALFPRKDVERISLAASQLMAMSWLPRVLSVFEQSNPSVRVEMLMEETPRHAEPDLVIRFGEDAALVHHPGWLMTLIYRVVGRPSDIERVEGTGSLSQFRLLDIRAHAVGWNTLLSGCREFRPEQLPAIVSVETTPLALAMVNEGLGLALVPWPVSRQLVHSLGLQVCNAIPGITGTGNYVLEISARRSPRAAVRALADALRQAGASERLSTS